MVDNDPSSLALANSPRSLVAMARDWEQVEQALKLNNIATSEEGKTGKMLLLGKRGETTATVISYWTWLSQAHRLTS